MIYKNYKQFLINFIDNYKLLNKYNKRKLKLDTTTFINALYNMTEQNTSWSYLKNIYYPLYNIS